MNDLLLDKTKDDIWKWFYCKHKCSLEEGLTLVKNDRDMDKMFQLANLHGTLDLYIGQIPQVFLVDYSLKNLCCVDSDEEVTLMELYKSDEMVIEVFFGSCFFFCPLDYPGRKILDLRLPRSTRMSYKEMTDLLLDKTKDDIWKLFYCKPKCKLEKGLPLVENDRDCEKMFELANFHGYLDVYVGHNLKLSYFIASTSKGKVVLDDFKDVATEKGRVVLDDFVDVSNGKDDSDLQLSVPLCLSNSSNTSLLQTQEMYVDGKATRIILDPTGIFQTDRIHKLNNFNDSPTLEYVRKLIDDVSEADDFKRRSWIMALEFINDNGEIGGGCFGDIKSYLKKEKLEKVVAIITSCTQNVLGDINVTLKDPSGTMSGTIHYKVLLDDGYDKAIKVGSALILHNFELLSEQVLLFVEREMERELRMTRLLTDLCHEVTDAIKNQVELIEEIKQLGGRAVESDHMTFVRILRGEDLDKEKSIMKLINETQEHTREKYTFIVKVKLDRK
ncbi:transposase, MuDR, MULE transposase domain protein [Tanacetum coccineum]